MKVNNDNSPKVDQVDQKHDDAKADEKKTKDGKSFKELLEGKKKRGEGKKDAARPARGREASAAKGRHAGSRQDAAAGPGGRRAGRQAGFDGKLRDGRLQLGQQSEQKARVDTERHTHIQSDERRTEHRHHKRHEHKVRADDTRRQEGARQEGSRQVSDKREAHAKSAGARIGERRERQERSVEAAAGDLAAGPLDAAQSGAANKADETAPAARSELREQVAELAKKLVDKAHVGRDASGRQIMLLDLQVPGRGNVRVRLRRRGAGFELRMRPENDELARDLRREREHFRQSAAEQGVDFSSIEIV